LTRAPFSLGIGLASLGIAEPALLASLVVSEMECATVRNQPSAQRFRVSGRALEMDAFEAASLIAPPDLKGHGATK
jgi:hypothetical protein